MLRALVVPVLVLALSSLAAAADKDAPDGDKATTTVVLRLPKKGAKIEVDGERQRGRHGRTVKLSIVPGTHTIHIELEGYESLDMEVNVGHSEMKVNVKMEESLPAAFPTVTDTAPPVPSPARPPPPPASPPPTPHTLRVAVLDIPASPQVNATLAFTLSHTLLADVQKRDGASALGQEDLFYRLPSSTRVKLRACRDDGCIVALGTSLGVDEIVVGGVTVLGENSLLSLRRLDLITQTVRSSVTRSVTAGQEENLMDQLGPALDELYGEHPLIEPRHEIPREVIEQLKVPPPLPYGVFIGTVVAGAAVAAVGILYGSASRTNQRSYETLADRSETQPVGTSNLSTLQTTSETQAHAANACFIAAGVVGIGAIVEIAFTNWHPHSAPPVLGTSVGFGPGGLQVSWK